MRPATIEGTTRTLAKPPEWTDEQCSSLAIRDIADEDGPAMLSLWTFSDAERLQVAAGANIELRICGTGHPPVSLILVAEPRDQYRPTNPRTRNPLF